MSLPFVITFKFGGVMVGELKKNYLEVKFKKTFIFTE